MTASKTGTSRNRPHPFPAALLLLVGLLVAATPLDRLIAFDVPLLRSLSAALGWILVLLYLWTTKGRLTFHHAAQWWALTFVSIVGVLELTRLLAADWIAYAGTPSIIGAAAMYMSWAQPVVLFLVVSMIASRRDSVRWVLTGLPIVTATLAITLVVGGETQRWAPIGLNANYAGLMFGFGSIIASAQTLSRHRGARGLQLLNALMIISIPLNLLGVLGSGGRGASAATAVGLVVLLLLSRLRLRQMLALGFTAFLVLVPLWPLYEEASQILSDRWERTLEREDYGVRDGLLRVTTELFAEQPIVGHGIRSTSVIGERWFGESERPFSAHNTTMTLLVSFGILGTLPWFVMLGSAIVHVWRHRRAENATLILAALTMFMTYMLAGSIMTNRFFYVTLGLAVCVHYWHSPRVSIAGTSVQPSEELNSTCPRATTAD